MEALGQNFGKVKGICDTKSVSEQLQGHIDVIFSSVTMKICCELSSYPMPTTFPFPESFQNLLTTLENGKELDAWSEHCGAYSCYHTLNSAA